MLRLRSTALISAFGLCLVCASQPARAAEFGFNIFPLGGLNFGAGQTPPPGFYVTPYVGYYQGNIGGNVTIGRDIALNLNAKFFQGGTNFLYAPPTAQFLGGQLAFSFTVPAGFIDLNAQVSSGGVALTRQTSGWGYGDMMVRGQLGWTHGHFSHTLYVSGFLPTGRYQPNFAPNIGLHRPAADITWGASYLEPTTMIEFSGAAGFTFNTVNTATDYLTGIESHVEWGIGKKIGQQLTIGVAGYHYWQLTGDSGSGARLGPFIGRNNGIGPGLTYLTQVAGHVVVVNLRHFWEYSSLRHFGSGTLSTASVTVRY